MDYRKYAEAFGAAANLGDARAANRNFNKLIAIGKKLRACGKTGESALRRLMKDRSDAVASWAATDSLPFAEAEALMVLDAIAKKSGTTAFDAKMTAELLPVWWTPRLGVS